MGTNTSLNASLMNGGCKSKRSEDPYTKTVEESTHNGLPIKLTVIHHDDAYCKEFVVSSPGFSVPKWILWTSVFHFIGYLLKLHTKVYLSHLDQ